jgi:hypothetical protein
MTARRPRLRPATPRLLPAACCWRCGAKLDIRTDGDGGIIVDCPPCRAEIAALKERVRRAEARRI